MKHPNDAPPEPERAELERQLESLRRDIRHLQLEHDLLKKANEILKKDVGVDLTVLGETRIPSLTSNSFAIRSSPHNGFSAAIRRIRLRSSGGIGGRPVLHFRRQQIRQPKRCQRTMVARRTQPTHRASQRASSTAQG